MNEWQKVRYLRKKPKFQDSDGLVFEDGESLPYYLNVKIGDKVYQKRALSSVSNKDEMAWRDYRYGQSKKSQIEATPTVDPTVAYIRGTNIKVDLKIALVQDWQSAAKTFVNQNLGKDDMVLLRTGKIYKILDQTEDSFFGIGYRLDHNQGLTMTWTSSSFSKTSVKQIIDVMMTQLAKEIRFKE